MKPGFEVGSSGRMWIALLALGLVAGLTIGTLDPGKIRTVVLILLAFFAVRIVLTSFASR